MRNHWPVAPGVPHEADAKMETCVQEVYWGVLVESTPVESKECRTEQTEKLNSGCTYCVKPQLTL